MTDEFSTRFQLPISKEIKASVRNNSELSDTMRKKFIRECATCLQVASESHGKIPDKDFEMAAKKICEAVSLLKDSHPPSQMKNNDPFPYWV